MGDERRGGRWAFWRAITGILGYRGEPVPALGDPYRAVVDAADEAVVLYDVEGTIRALNPAVERIFGYRADELIGRKVTTLAAEPDPSLFDPHAPAGGADREGVGRRSDGSAFPMILAVADLAPRAPCLRAGYLHDLSDRRRTERDLADARRALARTAEELASRDREIDEFSYVASHDLREPLRKLTAFSDLLQQDLGRELTANARRDLDYIVDASRRMQRLIDDLLRLARSGQERLEPAWFPLDRCVDAALGALAAAVEDSKAVIVRRPLPWAYGDERMIMEVFSSLLRNALKFRGARPPRVEILAEPTPEGWIVGVRDQGIGIRPEFAEIVFHPFKRLHGRAEYDGTGIGLTICKKIVERHHGRIWVEAAEGRGAHFRFMLGEMAERPPVERAA